MFKTREDMEAEERRTLAPYAAKSGDSAGRLHKEAQHPYRTSFQRDRARIIHCSAFRRLDGKTQVFLNGTGDHYRTRLTHTMEVASISRTIARALGLNEDLAETIALAHDLGHPPCGHAGEKTLNRLMRLHGGFNHNEQSLRIVELLEEKYPRHEGLNLSREVIEGLHKHDVRFVHAVTGETLHSLPLEAQAADMADEIAYSSHDLDDGLDSGLLAISQLDEVTLWRDATQLAAKEYGKRIDPVSHRGYIIRGIVNRMVDDLVSYSCLSISGSGAQSPGEARKRKRRLVGFSPEMQVLTTELRRFLFKNLYRHKEVESVNKHVASMIESLFFYLLAHPSFLGKKASRRISRYGLERTVADYISGMTDLYLAEHFHRYIHE